MAALATGPQDAADDSNTPVTAWARTRFFPAAGSASTSVGSAPRHTPARAGCVTPTCRQGCGRSAICTPGTDEGERYKDQWTQGSWPELSLQYPMLSRLLPVVPLWILDCLPSSSTSTLTSDASPFSLTISASPWTTFLPCPFSSFNIWTLKVINAWKMRLMGVTVVAFKVYTTTSKPSINCKYIYNVVTDTFITICNMYNIHTASIYIM
ncbi:uncharacterized protein LOC133641112 [Entelurus aequoreus]|uniref:uncharacterized protein LOC133641112 n=1 Tax=Entelurus aequoreus TaxID=161455 RepID=UPI002B1D63F2|nr:uncharacterized protein LOC133641112 [Entelurus aequoreus]